MFTTRSPYLERSVSDLDRDIIRLGTPIKVEPPDEDVTLAFLRQEEREDEHEQPPTQPEPRRSARIKAMNKPQDAVPPKVKTPTKSTSRKRAVRKK
jgi:hypothetical protein